MQDLFTSITERPLALAMRRDLVVRRQAGQGKVSLAVEDGAVEGCRLVLWLDAQFRFQGMSASFVLGQRRGTLTAHRQDAHHLAVALFAPRL